jgi:hypothetical protein
MGMEDKLYTSAEVAKETRREPRTIRSLAERHQIGRKIGRDWVFTPAELERFREVDPRGGKPRQDGKPLAYKVPIEKAKKKGPQKKQPLVDSPAVSS